MGKSHSKDRVTEIDAVSAMGLATAAPEETQEFNWGAAPPAPPEDEKDPEELVLVTWASCRSKPSPAKMYRSDDEEKNRRESMSWRRRASFIELDCGDDSFFVSNTYKTVGVADGVGGWKDYGVDPALFPNELMMNAKQFAETHRKELDPEIIAERAFGKTVHEGKVWAGSSTICVGSLRKKPNGKHYFDVANLGDNGIIVIKDRAVAYRFHEKSHGFNAPFQLGILPSSLQGKAYCDKVGDSIREEIEVGDGDVIVMGTNGLFDNMFCSQIAAHAGWIGKVRDKIYSDIPLIGPILSVVFGPEQRVEQIDPHRIAGRIVQEAYKHSLSEDKETPWSAMLRDFGVEKAQGGNVDDITLLISKVTTREELQSTPIW